MLFDHDKSIVNNVEANSQKEGGFSRLGLRRNRLASLSRTTTRWAVHSAIFTQIITMIDVHEEQVAKGGHWHHDAACETQVHSQLIT